MTINLSEHAGGGNINAPDSPYAVGGGINSGMEGTVSPTGNAITFVGLVKSTTVAQDRLIMLREIIGTATAGFQVRFQAGQLLFDVHDNVNVAICTVISAGTYNDGEYHPFKFEYDATAGTVSLLIDGADDDDLGYGSRLVTTGTMGTDLTNVHFMHYYNETLGLIGTLGHCGLAWDVGYNWNDFFDANNDPITIDETTWAAFKGVQPAFWHQYGWWTDNKGSAPNCTAQGLLSVVDALAVYPNLGLPTVGDAIPADILTDKIAWVDGVRLVGTSTGSGDPILGTDHPNLIAFWTGDNITGSTLVDQTGQNHGSPITGVTFPSGKFNNGMEFALSRRIKVPEAVMSIGVGEIKTYCAWIYNMVTQDSGAPCLFAAGLTGDNHMINMRTTGAQVEGDGDQSAVIASLGYTAAPVWQFATFVVDMANLTVDSYLDGVFANTGVIPAGNTFLLPTSNAYIGSYYDFTGFRGEFTGMMDHIRIFDRGLTPTEILTLANDHGSIGNGVPIDTGTGQPSLVGLNIVTKSRDLTDAAWTVREDPTITYDQIGLEGAANTATRVNDTTGFHSGTDQLAIPITGNVVTFRAFIKIEAGQPYGLITLYCRAGSLYYQYNITDTDGSYAHGIVFGATPDNVIWSKMKSVQYPGWWEIVIELPDVTLSTFAVSLTPGRGSSYGANIGGVTGWNTYGNVEAYDGLRLWQVISQPAEFND